MKTAKEYAEGFRLIETIDRDQRFPEYTGTEIWESGQFRFEIQNMGGITALQKATLSHAGEVLSYLWDLKSEPSLRKWIVREISKFIGEEK